MFCKNCGKQIDNDSRFCSYCGAKITIVIPPKEAENKKPETSQNLKEQIIQPNPTIPKIESPSHVNIQTNQFQKPIVQKPENKNLIQEQNIKSGNNSPDVLENVKVQMKPTIIWANIPQGTFIMGSPIKEVDRGNDETQHQVTVNAFKMSKYEITFEQYDMFCSATGKELPLDKGWGRGKRPVINVSWNDARAFAVWMGCRLPTEAEWEYACRAGTTTPFYTGDNITTLQANYNGLYPYNNNLRGVNRERTLPVGSFAPNPWGLHDMHGNVWEWCSDFNGIYQTNPQLNPKGPTTGLNRIVRGGSWSNFARNCRSAGRNDGDPEKGYASTGFRIVMSL